jgi:integrase
MNSNENMKEAVKDSKSNSKIDYIQSKVQTGSYSGPPMIERGPSQWMGWSEAYNAWLESKRNGSRTPSTVRVYGTAWKQFFRWAQVQPWEITPELARRWATWLATEGKEIKNNSGTVIRREGLSPRSVNLKLTAMSSFYNFVQENYDLWPPDRRNPFDTVKRNKINPYNNIDYPTIEEAKAILNAINTDCLTGKRDFALIFMVLVTCRKASEILNLKWGDIQQLVQGGLAFKYRCSRKQSKWAILPSKCYQILASYLKAADRFNDMEEDDYIFVAINPIRAERLPSVEYVDLNQPIHSRTANRILKKYARRVGVDENKAYIDRLRLTGVQLRIELIKQNGGNVDLEEIADLVGQNSMVIQQLYATSVLDDPNDQGGPIAAEALLPKKNHRLDTSKSTGGPQLVEESLSNIAQEIAKLEAQLAQLKIAAPV